MKQRNSAIEMLRILSMMMVLMVQVAISENIVFGAELQTAKTLIDECIIAWGADSRPEIVTPNEHGDWLSQRNDAFNTFIALGDKENKN